MGVDTEVEEAERVNSGNYRQSRDSYLKTERLSDAAPRASCFSNSFGNVTFKVVSTVVWVGNEKAWRYRG